VVVSTPEAADVLAIARRHGVPARQVGTVRRGSGTLRIVAGGRTIAAPIDRLREAYHDAIPRAMRSAATVVAAMHEPLHTT
jgi:hypothetical protein